VSRISRQSSGAGRQRSRRGHAAVRTARPSAEEKWRAGGRARGDGTETTMSRHLRGGQAKKHRGPCRSPGMALVQTDFALRPTSPQGCACRRSCDRRSRAR
jgi:hypothetical protein